MGNKDKFLQLNAGYILNFVKNAKELTEKDFRTQDTTQLFSIFSGGDGILDKNDYKNLWQLVNKYANQNNDNILDGDEEKALLEEINKNSDKKFDHTSLTHFLMKVFQRPDKVDLEDTAQLNVDFMELVESDVRRSVESTNDIEKMFNPNGDKTNVEYDENDKIKSKTLLDCNGKAVKIMFYDEAGEPSRIETKTQQGYEIIDLKPEYGDYSIIKTGEDKTKKHSETFVLDDSTINTTICKRVEYDSTNQGSRTEYVYDTLKGTNELLSIAEYKNGKKSKVTGYKEGRPEEITEYIYDNDYYQGKYPSEIRTYNARGNLTYLIDNKNQKSYDGKGNEIDEQANMARNTSDEEISTIASSLLKELSSENLSKLNSHNVLEIMSRYKYLSIKFTPEGDAIKQDLLDDILANPDMEARREQVKILVEALRGKIDNIFENNARVTEEMLERGKQIINQLLDDCLSDKADNNLIKDNIKQVLFFFKNWFFEFGGLTYTDTPNGKIDKYSYQNKIGDCWLLATLDSLSELKCGQEYLKQIIENNEQNQQVKIKLNGGKTIYTVSYEEIRKAYHYSIGDADMKALEIAFEKYFEEYKPNGLDSIDGGWQQYSYQILSGNEPKDTVIQNGAAGIVIDGEFIEINKKNRDKLKHIPINVSKITPDLMSQIKEVQNFSSLTVSSRDAHELSSHAYYITNISKEGFITVKEPNTPNLARTYTAEMFLKIYGNELTLFIM